MRLVGELVRDRRERLTLSIEDICKRSGVSTHTWVKAERSGDLRPSTIRRIANALGVEPEKLMGEPVLSGKDEAPLSPTAAEEPDEARRIIGSWGWYLSKQVDLWQDYLDGLPEPPSAEELKAELPHIEEILRSASAVYEAISNYGVDNAAAPYVDAIVEGRPIPEALRQDILNLYNALTVLSTSVVPRARGWASRQGERFQMYDELDAQANEWTTRAERVYS